MATAATDTRPVRFNFLLDNEPCAESQTVSWPVGWSGADICGHLKSKGEGDEPAWGIPDARSVLFYLVSETPEHIEITCRGFRDPLDAKAHVKRQKRRRELETLERRSDQLRAEGDRLLREAEAYDADQVTARSKMKASLLASQAKQLEAETGRRVDILARFNDWKTRMGASTEELRAARLLYERELAATPVRSSSPDAQASALSGLEAAATEIAGSLRDLAKKELKPERKVVSIERGPSGMITEMTVDEAS